MSSFWPEGVSLEDTQSPDEVLESAREEWESKSEGAITLVLQRGESESGNTMIVVHAKHVVSNRTVTLLSVVHRPEEPYPVTIQPRDEELPDILKRSRYIPGLSDVTIRMNVQGRKVENEWVSDTPSEFREKLTKALNLPAVKTAILSLVSDATTDVPEGEDNAPRDEASGK